MPKTLQPYWAQVYVQGREYCGLQNISSLVMRMSSHFTAGSMHNKLAARQGKWNKFLFFVGFNTAPPLIWENLQIKIVLMVWIIIGRYKPRYSCSSTAVCAEGLILPWRDMTFYSSGLIVTTSCFVLERTTNNKLNGCQNGMKHGPNS